MRSFGGSALESPVDAWLHVVMFFPSKPSNICSLVLGFKDPFDGRTWHTNTRWKAEFCYLLLQRREGS